MNLLNNFFSPTLFLIDKLGPQILRSTLQGTKISPQNGILKMIFLFPRWDMLIPWRVIFSCYVPESRLWLRVVYLNRGPSRRKSSNLPGSWGPGEEQTSTSIVTSLGTHQRWLQSFLRFAFGSFKTSKTHFWKKQWICGHFLVRQFLQMILLNHRHDSNSLFFW